jgi:hypothetical protein
MVDPKQMSPHARIRNLSVGEVRDNVAAPYWFIGMEEGGDSSNASLVTRPTPRW